MYIAPGQGAYSPQGTKFWCQQKLLVTSVICCLFQIIDDNSFWKIHCLIFFPYKSIRDQIWPCRKICQGQSRVIIWTNLVVLEHPMLHTMLQGHRPFVSGEEDFLRFLPYMGMAAMLVMWPGPFEQTFVPSSHEDSIWNLASIGPVVSEMLKECGRQATDDKGLPILKFNIVNRGVWLKLWPLCVCVGGGGSDFKPTFPYGYAWVFQEVILISEQRNL